MKNLLDIVKRLSADSQPQSDASARAAVETAITSRCAHCGAEGGVGALFGTRAYKGTVFVQSWCRRCRTEDRCIE